MRVRNTTDGEGRVYEGTPLQIVRQIRGDDFHAARGQSDVDYVAMVARRVEEYFGRAIGLPSGGDADAFARALVAGLIDAGLLEEV
jgi:hypothetical protein